MAAEDFRGAVVGVYYFKKDREEFLAGAWGRWAGCFNKLLEGKEYLSLGKFTTADIAVFDVISQALDKIPDVPMESFPNLKAHFDRIGARPNIAAFMASNSM